MRTYDDTFSGQKIYPGKVSSIALICHALHRQYLEFYSCCASSLTSVWLQGKLYVRGDSKIFRFQNGKSESLFLQRKNPRRIAWTTLYRRQHRKGISEVRTLAPNPYGVRSELERFNYSTWFSKALFSELCSERHHEFLQTWCANNLLHQQEVAKKRTRRTIKHQRAIVGAPLEVIKERRSMRPEARAAARQAAVKESKEKKAALESKKKAEKAKSAAAAARGTAQRIQSKQGAKGAAQKVQAKSR